MPLPVSQPPLQTRSRCECRALHAAAQAAWPAPCRPFKCVCVRVRVCARARGYSVVSRDTRVCQRLALRARWQRRTFLRRGPVVLVPLLVLAVAKVDGGRGPLLARLFARLALGARLRLGRLLLQGACSVQLVGGSRRRRRTTWNPRALPAPLSAPHPALHDAPALASSLHTCSLRFLLASSIIFFRLSAAEVGASRGSSSASGCSSRGCSSRGCSSSLSEPKRSIGGLAWVHSRPRSRGAKLEIAGGGKRVVRLRESRKQTSRPRASRAPCGLETVPRSVTLTLLLAPTYHQARPCAGRRPASSPAPAATHPAS